MPRKRTEFTIPGNASDILRKWMSGWFKNAPTRISSPYPWSEIISCAVDNGLAPLLYHFLSRETSVPEEYRTALRTHFENAIVVYEYAAQQLKNLRNYIDGPDPLLIQGAALIETIYNKECLRPLSDVDILIDPLQRDSVARGLERCGFSRIANYGSVWIKGGCCIDVHEDPWGLERIPQRAQFVSPTPTAVAKSWIKGFALPDDRFLAIHALYHSVKHGFSRMIWDWDMLVFLKQGTLEKCFATPVKEKLFRLALRHLNFAYDLPENKLVAPSNPVSDFVYKRLFSFCRKRNSGDLLFALFCGSTADGLFYLWYSLFPGKSLTQMYGERNHALLLARRIVSLVRSMTGGYG